MNWEVSRVFAWNWAEEPAIPEGWEPFSVQAMTDGACIWLRRPKVDKGVDKGLPKQIGSE